MKTTTMTLPDVVTRYIEAANRFDVAAATDCFTSDASVHDEHRDHTGQDAICSWVAETSRKYHPHCKVIQAKVSREKIKLSVSISGTFPGSPIELEYQLRLRDGKISTLVIT